MTVELDAEEAAAVRQLVDARLVNLSSEIRHTDSPSVRRELRDLRDTLRRLRERLEPVAV
jgi:hypothetical protein